MEHILTVAHAYGDTAIKIIFSIALLVLPLISGCGRESGNDAGNLGEVGAKAANAARKAVGTADEKTREAARLADKKKNELAQSVEDAALKMKIAQALARAKDLSSVKVSISCEKGVATVAGTAPNPSLRRKTLDLVQAIRGVSRVIPQITVEPEKNKKE